MSLILAFILAVSEDPGVTVQESRQAMAKLAECTVKHKHDQVAAELLAGHSSDKMRSAFISMLDRRKCPTDWKGAGAILIMMLSETAHYSMAEALVAADLKTPVKSLADAPKVETSTFDASAYEQRPNRKYSDEQLRNLQKSADRARYISELSKVGDCVVRTDTEASHRLLLSPIDSSQESSTFAALKPAIGKCLLTGQSFRLDKALLRGAVAFNFYRLATAAGVHGGIR
jgi:hypothetical protein